jgi:hypothetical protein
VRVAVAKALAVFGKRARAMGYVIPDYPPSPGAAADKPAKGEGPTPLAG